MSQLQNNLREILRQKNRYLLPENLKKDITLLGVTGTLDASSETVLNVSGEDVYIDGSTLVVSDAPSLPETPIYNLQDYKSTTLKNLTWDGNDLVFNADTVIDTNIAQSELSNGYTIIVKAYPTAVENWRGIFGVAHGSPASGMIGFQPTDGQVLYTHHNIISTNVATPYTANKWNVFTARYKFSGNLLEVYKSLVLVASTSGGFAPYGNIIVGKAGDITDTRYYFKGKLNQFIVYNRALSDAEMEQVMDYIERSSN